MMAGDARRAVTVLSGHLRATLEASMHETAALAADSTFRPGARTTGVLLRYLLN